MVYPKPIAPFIVVVLVTLLSNWAGAAPFRSWGLGIMSWPEEIQISDPNGKTYEATAQFYTPSVHYDYREYRAKDGLLYEGYLLYGKADIQDQSANQISYFQKRVPMYGVGAAVGWYARPEGKQVNIGVSVPVQYRHAQWTDPGSGFSVNKKDVFAFGLVLDMRWRFTETLAINQRLGGFFSYKSALWMMNLEWAL